MTELLAMLAVTPDLIRALPQLCQFINRILTLLEARLKKNNKKEIEAFLTECSRAIDALEKAQSAEEKRHAAQALVDLIHRL